MGGSGSNGGRWLSGILLGLIPRRSPPAVYHRCAAGCLGGGRRTASWRRREDHGHGTVEAMTASRAAFSLQRSSPGPLSAPERSTREPGADRSLRASGPALGAREVWMPRPRAIAGVPGALLSPTGALVAILAETRRVTSSPTWASMRAGWRQRAGESGAPAARTRWR